MFIGEKSSLHSRCYVNVRLNQYRLADGDLVSLCQFVIIRVYVNVVESYRESITMALSPQNPPILLRDEQIRQYIVNGYVTLKPSIPAHIHQVVCRKLTDCLNEDGNPGNNVLPKVAEMRHILNSPEVQGALISVLGGSYLEHPHRHCHHLTPAPEATTNAKGRMDAVAANCHQDAYTPLGRPRQHYSRYARIMYYPQDTPVEMGSTHVIPGTQFNQGITNSDRARAIPVDGAAGTVVLTHFDVGHAAGLNTVNQPRHMVKFIYVRAMEPVTPSWNCQRRQWQKPTDVQAPYDLNLTWSHMWDWMCGKRDRYHSFRQNNSTSARNVSQLVEDLDKARDVDSRLKIIHQIAFLGAQATEAIPYLIETLNTDHQAVRLAAIYTLGIIGQPTVEPLIASLKGSGVREDAYSAPQPWNEGAILMDDAAFALTAVGPPAVEALIGALDDTSEWTRINAAFALGELDSHAANAVPRLIECLNDKSHRLVRTILDALGSICQGVPPFVTDISQLLLKEEPSWEEALHSRRWTAQDQIRINAAMALSRLGQDAADVEDILIQALDDPCGHVGAFAMGALKQLDSTRSKQSIMSYLEAQRWDESIRQDRLY